MRSNNRKKIAEISWFFLRLYVGLLAIHLVYKIKTRKYWSERKEQKKKYTNRTLVVFCSRKNLRAYRNGHGYDAMASNQKQKPWTVWPSDRVAHIEKKKNNTVPWCTMSICLSIMLLNLDVQQPQQRSVCHVFQPLFLSISVWNFFFCFFNS